MKKIVLISALGMLFSGVTIAQQNSQNGYVTVNSTGKALKSGTGLCWQTSADKIPEKDCGDEMEGAIKVDVKPAVEPSERIVLVEGVKKSAVATVDVTILFAFDSSVLSSKAKQLLKDMVNNYALHTIVIEGYTDQIGNNSYNKTLSNKRALVVKKYLRDLGVSNEAFESTKGFGKSNPVVKCDPLTIKCEQPNRRTRVLGTGLERN